MRIFNINYSTSGWLRYAGALLFACLLCVNTQAALSGNYTIDPSAAASSSNYKTFASAVSDMVSGTRADGGTANGSGVTGSVVFKVANGTYTEQITIPAITGASAARTITFQSASGDSSKVILSFQATSTATNFVVKLNGATYINFKQISMINTSTSTSYGRVIEIGGGSHQNTFIGNYLQGYKASTSAATGRAVVYSPSDKDTSNTFTGNYLKYGGYGIYLLGSSTAIESGYVISNNIIDSVYDNNIHLTYKSAPVVSGNTIGNSLSSASYGIYLSDVSGAASITGNKIISPIMGYGLYITASKATSSATALIANNFITFAGTSGTAGIYLLTSQYYDVFHNSVWIRSTSATAKAIYINAGSATSPAGNHKLYNNIFANTGGGLAIEVTANAVSSNQIDTSDYNNIYVTGTNVAKLGSTSYTSFSAYQVASAQDANSISADPKFKSTTDLHVDASTTPVNAKALALNNVTTDFDGETRSTTKPDIGADEVKGILNNIGIASLISPAAGFCAGNFDLTVKVANAGGNKIDSFYIGYYIDGVFQSAKKYTTTIDEGETANIKIGTISTSATAKNIKVYVYNPNGKTDPVSANDTILAVAQAGMTGTYSIGTGKDYTTFTAAVNDLKNRGLCSAVTFEVYDGTYTEQISIPEIAGASSSNTITFRSKSADSSKVILQFASSASANYVVQLNGADYITFKQISIISTSTSTSSARVVDMSNGAHHNTLSGNYIKGYFAASTSNNIALVFSNTTKDSANTVTGNNFKYGSTAVVFEGATTAYEEGNTVSSNIIDSVYDDQIRLAYQDRATVTNNKITNAISTGGFGIYINVNRNGAVITGNYITTTNTTYGIYINGSAATSSLKGLIANNMITFGGTGGTTGIYLNASQYYDVLHNSINIRSSSATARAIYVNSTSTSAAGNHRLFNNIFANSGSGLAMEVTANAITTSQIDTSDFNDFYSTGAGLVKWGTTTYTTLSAYKTASNQDPNSVSANPRFNSATNLHTFAIALDNAGTPVSVTTDIDGETRNTTTPDIGADEFTAPTLEAILDNFVSPLNGDCPGSHDVTVKLSNGGKTKIDSLYITYVKNGLVISSTKYNVNLSAGKDTSIVIGSTSLNDSLSTLRAYITKVNNTSTDNSQLTDTIQAQIQAALSGTYTVGAGKNFTSFTDAVTNLKNRGVCGKVTFNIDNGTYTEQVSIPQIKGTSASSTITFQSASGDSSKVILTQASSTSSTNNYTLLLDGADYITFNKITISRTGTNTNGRVIEVSGAATYNKFSGNFIMGTINTATTTSAALVYSSSDLDNYNTFSGNLFKYGSYGFYYFGSSSTSREKGTLIQNNILDSAYYYALDVEYQDSAQVLGNTITNQRNSSTFGMNLRYFFDGSTVQNNKIYLLTGSKGLHMEYANSNSSTFAPVIVANNFISVGGTATGARGFDIDYCKNLKAYYNSILMYNTNSTSAAVYLWSSTGTSYGGIVLKNNIFANTGGGYALDMTTTAATLPYVDSSDYNDFYATGATLARWGATSATTLAALRTASGKDANSVSVDPKFRSNTDLHIKALSNALDGKAIPTVIKTDIDKQTRNSTTPDIGADEYDALANDLNIVSILKPVTNTCGDSNTILSIIISNEGSSSQSSYNVGAVVEGPNGKTTLSQSSSRSIASDAKDTITFSTKINTYVGGSFKVKAYTALSTDANNLNDTTTSIFNFYSFPVKPGVTDVARCGNGNVTLTATTATGNTILWYTAASGGTSIATGSSFTTPTLFATTTYYVSAKNASGCEGPRTAIKAIVNPIPTGASIAAGTIFNGTSNAGTSANPDEVCPGSKITYNVTPPTSYNNSGYNTTWNYSFSIKTASGTIAKDTTNTKPTTSANGIIGFTPVFTLSDSTVILNVTVKDVVTGCDSSFSRYIHISPAPKIAFSMADRCGAGSVSFTNNTTVTSGTVSYVWSFGDGDTSSAQNPTHTYAATGTYTVKLVAANSNGCKDSLSKTVTVYPVPTAAFTANNGCTNNAISFSNASTVSSGTLSYMWTFGDGSSSTATNPAKAFSAAGTYAVKLVVTGDGGCKDSVTKNITIENTPQTGFTKGSVFNGVFNNGTAANPDIVCALYTLTYDITTPTGYSNSAYGTDWEISQISFKTPKGTAAADTSVTLPSASGGGKIIFTPAFNTADSSFKLTLTIKNKVTGCDTTITRYVSVLSAPDADFTAVNACANEAVVFTDESVIGGGTGNYKWYFGDGDTSSSQSPSHIYATAGTYTVSLVVTVGSGCNDSITKTITVYPRATPNFTFVAGCLDSAVSFTDVSTLSSGTISSYAWNFGDGGTASISKPTHIYSAAGTYTVKMVVTTSNGCKDSVSKSVTVNPLPKPTFTYVSHCADSAVSFTNTSTVTSGSIVSYTWKFGDGSTSTSNSPSHVYTGSGNFTVTLIATSNLGCKDSSKQTITVYPKPSVSFTTSGSCLSANASFTNTSTIPTGFTIASYLWKFGDGTTSTSANPTKKYSAAGTYTVTLIATSLRGCTDSAKNTITIYPQPVSNFTFTNRCLDSTISFTNSSTISSGSIASYLWNFGNGSTSTSASPTKVFSAAGTYSVKLVVTSDKGCKDSVTKTVTVYPKPVVSFSSPNTCVTSAASFTDKSTVASGSIVGYLWRFGDGGTSTSKNSTHTYASAGSYNVTLRVTTNNGCVDSTVVTKAITIYAQPAPSFTQTNRCQDSAIDFTSTSTVTDGTIASYSWDFGDGSNGSTSANPSYTYAAAGSYTVKLTVTSSNGCTNSTSKTVTVYPKANVGFTSASAVCLYDSISFANTSTIASGYNIIGYKWNFGDGSTATTTNAAHKYANSGKYTVTLSATTANGCVSTYSQDITINALPQTSFTATTVCETGTTVFTNTSVASSQGALNYTWNFGDGSTSAAKSPTHKYATGGSYTVSLIVRNAGGCSDTMESTIKVNFKPVAGFTAKNGCAGQNVNFTDNSTIGGDSIASYIWAFGDGSTSTNQNPTHAYTNPGRYTIRLIVASDKGCSDTAESTITIFAVPTAGFTATTACEGSGTQFKNSISSSAFTYKWIFGDGDSSTLENPLHQYAAAGTYTVNFIVTNASGCATTVTQNVKVNAKPVASFTTQDECFGNAANFVNTSTVTGDSIISYAWDFGDGNTSTDMSPSHLYSSNGTYNVTLTAFTATCSDTFTQIINISAKPVAAFTANEVCLGNATQFNNGSTIAPGNSMINLWVFDNKDTSTAQSPSFTFATTGKHKVTLVVTSNSGCTDSVSKEVTVNPLPSLTVSHTTTERNVKFTVSDSSNTSYAWSFGDGSTSTDKNPAHRYPATGNYNVTVVVKNASGCEATFSDTVNITTNGVDGKTTSAFKVDVYPNPFKEATTLVYNLSKPATVRAAFYDIQGKEITVLVSNVQQSAGKYTYTINAEQNHIQSGVYMLRVIVDGIPVTKQIIRVE